jgi:hypothetical protein
MKKNEMTCVGKTRNIYRILVGKSERKASFGRIKDLLEDSIVRGLRETGWEFVDSTHLNLHEDKFFIVVQTIIKFRIP